MTFAEQLDGVTEADSFGAHHPVDGRASRAARTETVPEIFLRADDQTRFVVVVEGTEADEVRTVPFKFHPARLGQTFDGDFTLEPLDLALRDSRHRSPFSSFSTSSPKPCQEDSCSLKTLCKIIRCV